MICQFCGTTEVGVVEHAPRRRLRSNTYSAGCPKCKINSGIQSSSPEQALAYYAGMKLVNRKRTP